MSITNDDAVVVRVVVDRGVIVQTSARARLCPQDSDMDIATFRIRSFVSTHESGQLSTSIAHPSVSLVSAPPVMAPITVSQ